MRECIAEGGNVRSDILIDALEAAFLANAIISQVGRGGKVEVVCVTSETRAEAEGEFGLEMVYLRMLVYQ